MAVFSRVLTWQKGHILHSWLVLLYVFYLCFYASYLSLLKFSLSSLTFIISVLNSASRRWLISLLFSSFSGVFFHSFLWENVFCLFACLLPCFDCLPVFVSMYYTELPHLLDLAEWHYVVGVLKGPVAQPTYSPNLGTSSVPSLSMRAVYTLLL